MSTRYDFSRLSVLVVDDNANMKSLADGILKRSGVGKVEAVESAEDAEAAMRSAVFDILLIDWMLPKKSGYDLVKEIRQAQAGKHRTASIIMMTAHTEFWRVLAMRDAGATEVLAKPISPATMIGRIMAVVNKPRPFVQVDSFFGPDRRRRYEPVSGDEEKREEELKARAAALDIDKMAEDPNALSQDEINALFNP